MTTRGRVLVVGCMLAAAAVLGTWLLYRQPQQPELAPPPAPTSTVANPPAATAPAETPIAATAAREPIPISRSPSPEPPTPQGLRGLVVGPDQRPLAGRPVYLVDSASNDPLAMPLMRLQRDAFSPIARSETAGDGTFAIGLPIAQDRIYELYVTSPAHATARLGGLRLLAGEWHDLGTITLTPGATVRGRVTVAGSPELPVPGASVQVEIGTAFADAALRALPDASTGTVATTDALGRYEIAHVPSSGAVQMRVVAHGFACACRAAIELRADEPAEVNFELHPGHSLGGQVFDSANAPIANARIEAWPMATGEPLFGTSGADGRFTVIGLATGKYRVRVAARGYEPAQLPDIDAGREDLRFALVPHSRVRVRVQSPRGDTLRSYQLGLRRSFDEGTRMAPVPEVPDQRVQLDGFTDWAEILGVPSGFFRCQVEADGFAKSVSAPFDNQPRLGEARVPRAFEVVVTMSPGATLEGRIVDEGGAPLAGASVRTEAAGTFADNPLSRLLSGALADAITVAVATADADGHFALRLLAPGDYQLVAEHAAACRTTVRDLRLGEGERTLPPIVLPAGATVSGRATVGGRVGGQIKVVLTTPAGVTDAKAALRLETVSDAAGVYRMPRRVPPGTYELRAASVGTAAPEAQTFQQLLQLQRSSVTVVIPPGQRQVERDIDLPSDH